ncbi:MAG: Hsp70 family protein [Armatimonadetes bacterium]|nr:Hsp70 family protein [Armatimonadota bacterium]MBM3947201.1 Hsp70 family protein [SAR202 cluster bacterium]
MEGHWAIDLGTTNTVVATEQDGSVRAVYVADLARRLPVEQFPLIPSAIHVLEERGPWWTFFKRTRRALIGQPALSRNFDGRSPAFAQSFKPLLAAEPHRALVRIGEGPQLSVRDVTHLFLKELLTALRREHRAKITDLTIPAPVGYFEQYRAELQASLRRLGVRRFRSLDEPVAAALGYGVNIARDETLLVVDFGGGTLNLAVLRLGPHTAMTGKADVLAKHMVRLGGNDVDLWILDHLFPAMKSLHGEWPRDLIWEAVRVKEALSTQPVVEFQEEGLTARLTREEFVEVLIRRGLYDQLRIALDDIRRQLEETPGARPHVDEVLMVGGSTQLPGVPAVVDDFFPQAVVRHDLGYVFTSVAMGAARYASGAPVEDFVYHDYAIAVQSEHTHSVEYELIVPRRTRYPTPPDFAVRYYKDFPGMEEVRFSVSEIGRLGQAPVAWELRPTGHHYWGPRNVEERALASELNPADAALALMPKGQGTNPRLRVTYSVNEDRWLCTTVEDLVRKQPLRVEEPVVRLR